MLITKIETHKTVYISQNLIPAHFGSSIISNDNSSQYSACYFSTNICYVFYLFPSSIILFSFSVLTLFWVIILTFSQIHLVLNNITTNENANWSRYSYLNLNLSSNRSGHHDRHYDIFFNPFDMGSVLNTCSFFFPKRGVWRYVSWEKVEENEDSMLKGDYEQVENINEDLPTLWKRMKGKTNHLGVPFPVPFVIFRIVNLY